MNLLSKLFSKSGAGREQTSVPAEGSGWDVRSLCEVLRHFPIGARVLYCPEFKKELRLESILLGCSINQHIVCSQSDLTQPGPEDPDCIVLRADGEDAHIREVKSFYLVIPHQLRSEVDYRPSEPRSPAVQMVQNTVNDFERGNYVRLISYSPYGRVPHLETRVKGTSALTKGYYAGHKVVFLDPYPNTLSYVDKRRHQRVGTRIPASLQLSPEGEEHRCVVEDFSERFLRARLADGDPFYADLKTGGRLLLHLDLSHSGKTATLQASVYRKARGALVLELRAFLKEGRFASLHLVDQLELKATLLHHPETQKILEQRRRS